MPLFSVHTLSLIAAALFLGPCSFAGPYNDADTFCRDESQCGLRSDSEERDVPDAILKQEQNWDLKSPACPEEHFYLHGMEKCRKYLTCIDIEKIEKIEIIGEGAVKQVFLAKWENYLVVYCNLTLDILEEDFQYGVRMLRHFQRRFGHVTQLLGQCHNTIVTEYYPLGSADGINEILSLDRFFQFNTVEIRLRLCLDFVRILFFFHTQPEGAYVMCDSNSVEKMLSQFLITSDFRLVVNDLDALPLVVHNETLIKCGHRQIISDFVAPEQLWPHSDQYFTDELMPAYDEKTDIWKIPSTVEYLLGDAAGVDVLKFHLFKIHKQCKQLSSRDRPSAKHVLDVYEELYSMLTK